MDWKSWISVLHEPWVERVAFAALYARDTEDFMRQNQIPREGYARVKIFDTAGATNALWAAGLADGGDQLLDGLINVLNLTSKRAGVGEQYEAAKKKSASALLEEGLLKQACVEIDSDIAARITALEGVYK